MIDEKKLIEKLNRWYDILSPRTDIRDSIKCDVIDNVMTMIEDVGKVGEWILCSERKPRELIDVLVTVQDIQNGDDMLVMIGNYKDWWQVYDIDGTEQSKARVFAWQPLPEPYREESAE